MSETTSTWYRVAACYKAEPVEVVRESGQCVWINHHGKLRREKKVSEWGKYYPSAQEALDALRDRAARALAQAEQEVIELRQILADSEKGQP